MGWVIRAIFDDPIDIPAWIEILLVCPDGTTVFDRSPTATAFHEDMAGLSHRFLSGVARSVRDGWTVEGFGDR